MAKVKVLQKTQMPVLSATFTLFINIQEIVRLTGIVPMVMVGVFVALAAKVMLVLPPPGILALTEAIFLILDIENKKIRDNKQERKLKLRIAELVGVISVMVDTNIQLGLGLFDGNKRDESASTKAYKRDLLPVIVTRSPNFDTNDEILFIMFDLSLI